MLGGGYVYTVGPFKTMDFVEPYLPFTLGIIGIADLEIVRVENLNMGPQKAAEAMARARQRVSEI